ncbi:MAG: hypothetical protein V7642_1522 [Burkholderiales bacterium]
MATGVIDPLLLEANGGSAQPELLISAALHLMSHYSANSGQAGACVKLAAVIERHLKALADLPELAPVLRATCEQLAEQWAATVERALPRPAKSSVFTRLIAGTLSH